MDALGPYATAGTIRRQAGGFLQAVRDNSAKTEDSRGVSPLRAAALTEVAQSFIRKRVQTTRGDIFFNLAVPVASVELREPGSERSEFRGRELEYGILDLFCGPHTIRLSSPARSHNRDHSTSRPIYISLTSAR